MTNKHRMPPIAVVGIGALFPGEAGADGFWRTIVAGKDCIGEIPSGHWLIEDYYDPDQAVAGKTFARRGAFLSPVEFDAMEHGIPPSALPATDSAQLLALIVAKQVLENCRDIGGIDRDRIAVILGGAGATELTTTMSGSLQRPLIEKHLKAAGLSRDQVETICDRISESYVPWVESTFPGLLGNVVAGRIANRFDLGGMNCVIDAACASSLAAINTAIDQLRTGAADMVITGGVDAINDILMYMCFSKTLAMSMTGDCRPFSDNADGTMLGEGIGMFALRRLEDAEESGDHIYAVLRGIGSSSDGRAKSIYAPRAEGQAKALRRAYEVAGYGAETVELVEAHGTGTVAGDAAEVSALTDVFREARSSGSAWCALGSIKSQIGHTKAAAGAASLFKTVMSLHNKVLPATLKIREPNPALGLDSSPFYLNTETRPWIRSPDHPRRASVSSFGFGGSNFHLTLEEYQGKSPKPPRIRTVETELFLFSGESSSGMLSAARACVQSDASPGAFAAAAHDSQEAFHATAVFRLAVVASGAEDLGSKIDWISAAIRRNDESVTTPTGIFYRRGEPAAGKIAFLFPGQGSQYLGMTGALCMAFEDARTLWEEAPDVAGVVFPQPVFGKDARRAQAARLTDTSMAQPAIAVASQICLDILTSAGVKPDFCAGHSFGEISALHSAGVLSQPDFMRVARERGRLMAEAAATLPGAMAAVACSPQKIEETLRGLGPDLVIANFNSPRQVVIGGPSDQIEAALAHFSSIGTPAKLLPVSTAFHSPIVDAAAAPLSAFLETIDFRAAQIAVYANTTAQAYPEDAVQARRLLGGQLAKPVRFVDEVSALFDAGARTFIEVGPGAVLTDLVGVCLEGRRHASIALDAKGKNDVTALWFAFGKLAALGVPFNTQFAWKDYSVTAPPPRKASSATVKISGTNFGKKYPAEISSYPLPSLPRVAEAPSVSRYEDSTNQSAVQLIQEKMAEAHAAAQRAMAESHLAYLRTSEMTLGALLGGQVPANFQATPVVTPMPEPTALRIRPVAAEVAKVARDLPKAPPAVVDVMTLDQLVLSVIAKETGYPVDILTPGMDLEADLGIDSIKRVQILAAVSAKRPDLPEVEAKAMAGIRTIGAITAYLSGSLKTPPPIVPARPVPARPLNRLGLKEVDAPARNGVGPLFSAGQIWAIVGCNDGIGTALAGLLREQGVEANVSPGVPLDAQGTVFLDFAEDPAENITAHAQRVFGVARGFASSQGANSGALIMVQARGSGWRSGMRALARTVALEHPDCRAHTIEIERSEMSPREIAGIIAAEISAPRSVDNLLVNTEGRYSMFQDVERPIAAGEDHDLLAGKPVIVASGGARGITAACLLAAAGKAPLRAALFGRTVLVTEPAGFVRITEASDLKRAVHAASRSLGESLHPRQLESKVREILRNREIRSTLEAFRELGSEAIYIPVDVTDEAATEAAAAQVRKRWGGIDMLVHGAGVLADKRIADKTPEQFMRVFNTKVLGLRSLLAATRNDRLRFLCVFSSVAGRYGNAGQADYAMANSALNQVAREEALRRGSQCVVRSLNWGPWHGGMVTRELRDLFAARRIAVIDIEAGADAFVRELQYKSSDPADVDVVLAATI